MDLRIADAETALTVARLGTVNGAARALGVTPSQVSKAIARLERYLGTRLLVRGARGTGTSEVATRLLPALAELVDRARSLGRRDREPARLVLVAPAYLAAALAPALVAALPEVSFDFVEAPPGVPSAYAGLPFFDLALGIGEERWPGSWSRARVGRVRRALFATPRRARALGRVSPESLAGERFLGPVYSERGEPVAGDDRCPLPRSRRRFGHRTQTAGLALELAARTDQVVFAPVLAARPLVERGALVEVPVRGWSVYDPLYLVCHVERVSARVQRLAIATLRKVVEG